MPKKFLGMLAAVAVVQFVVTRSAAGRAIEEGRAERLWMLYPLNVVASTVAWMLVFAAASRVHRLFRAS